MEEAQDARHLVEMWVLPFYNRPPAWINQSEGPMQGSGQGRMEISVLNFLAPGVSSPCVGTAVRTIRGLSYVDGFNGVLWYVGYRIDKWLELNESFKATLQRTG